MKLTQHPTLMKALLAIACVLSITNNANAQRLLDRDEIKELNGVEVTEQLGNYAAKDAVLIDSEGKVIEFGSYLQDDQPVILVMVYYQCPMVCPTVLSQLQNSLNELDYTAGEDYKLLVVSFDHTETTSMALGERTNFLGEYDRGQSPSAQAGIQFHTAEAMDIKKLVNSIGFAFNPMDNGDFSHPISLMILSPNGKVSRYMYGFDYPPQELKLSLLDASEGKIAESWGDRLMHFCYQFDPLTGSYSLQAFRVMQIGALLTVVLIIIGLTILFMGDRVRRKAYLAKLAQESAQSELKTSEQSLDDSDHSTHNDFHSSHSSSGSLAGAQTGQVS